MYAREVEGKTLTLAVSGYLWNDSLVMQDQETKTYWSHILGEAKSGPLKGKKLKPIPSVMTDWESWSQRHPDGTVVVLSRTSEDYRRESFDRLSRFVLGVVVNDKATAWSFDLLDKTPARNDRLGNKPVLVAFDRKSVTARLYERELGGRVLTFRLVDERLTDQETGSTWDPVVGRAVAGPLQGKFLVPLPAIVSYDDVWKAFHPRSEIHSRE